MINDKTLDRYIKGNFCKIFSFHSVNAETVGKEIHRHNFFQIILLKKGTIKHWIDFQERESEGYYASVIFPNQVHRMSFSPDAEADIIMFDDTVFCSAILSNELKEYNIDLQSRLNNVSNIPEAEWKQIRAIYDSIMVLWPDVNLVRKNEIKLMIKIILLKIINVAPQSYPVENLEPDIQIYRKFVERVNKEFATQKKVIHYAGELGVSTKKLTRVCFKYAGHSPLEIIHDKLSIELKKAFVEEGLLIKEIAFNFGFSSQSALNKFIERRYGVSPQVWRAELEKNMLGRL